MSKPLRKVVFPVAGLGTRRQGGPVNADLATAARQYSGEDIGKFRDAAIGEAGDADDLAAGDIEVHIHKQFAPKVLDAERRSSVATTRPNIVLACICAPQATYGAGIAS